MPVLKLFSREAKGKPPILQALTNDFSLEAFWCGTRGQQVWDSHPAFSLPMFTPNCSQTWRIRRGVPISKGGPYQSTRGVVGY